MWELGPPPMILVSPVISAESAGFATLGYPAGKDCCIFVARDFQALIFIPPAPLFYVLSEMTSAPPFSTAVGDYWFEFNMVPDPADIFY